MCGKKFVIFFQVCAMCLFVVVYCQRSTSCKMNSLKLVLLAHFIQLMLQVHESIMFCCEAKSNVEMPLRFLGNVTNTLESKTIYHNLLSYIVLYHCQLSFIYKSLFDHELGDWLKA
jgi:hypothetical protein